MMKKETTMKIQQQTSNVVSFNAFKSKSSPPQQHHSSVEIRGKKYPIPKNGDEYLALVKKILIQNNMEDEYKEILCAIMDPEYYQANYQYYTTKNGKSDQHYPLYRIVDAYLGYF